MTGSGPGWPLVWPAWQRLLHAVVALTVLTALLRVLLGLAGPGAARFSAFVRGLSTTRAYARRVLDGTAERHLNHNPLGAWLVMVLLALALLAGISGALYVTDRFWGEAWVIAWHAMVAWPLVAMVPLHVAGVVHASRAHHENLAAAMVHGRKPQRPGDV